MFRRWTNEDRDDSDTDAAQAEFERDLEREAQANVDLYGDDDLDGYIAKARKAREDGPDDDPDAWSGGFADNH